MIIVKLKGGLGNQMFQYAIGLNLSRKNKTKLILDLTDYKNDPLRHYELDCFTLERDRFITSEESKTNKLKFKILSKILKNYSYFVQSDYKSDMKILKFRGNAIIDGYWQSENYFLDIRKRILDNFTLRRRPDEKNQTLLKKILNTNSIALHVRRGDYVTDKKTNLNHGTCSLDYYQNSIKYLSKRVQNPVYFVFSDDPKWVKENISTKAPTTYVDINTIDTGYEDLRLMSNCKHFIIANSSFSWWGAWLSRNNHKIICAPERWFVEHDEGDIVPKSWIRVGG